MPRTYLIRSNPYVTDGPTESNQDDCEDEEAHGSNVYEEGSNISNTIQYGNDPIDLSTSKSAQLRTSSHEKSSPEIKGYNTCLSSHNSNVRLMNNQRTVDTLRDRFALPSEKQGTRPDLDLFLDERNSSQNIQKEPRNQYTRDVYRDNGRSLIDAYPFQNGDVFINGYPSRCFREPIQRTSNVFKDLTRIVEEESGMQPSRSSCMSLLEEYYAQAVAKRNIVRDLRRELHSSDISERDLRGSTILQRREQQYFRGMLLTGDLNVSSTPKSEIDLGNGPKPFSKDRSDSSRNTRPMYRPKWDNEGRITSEPEMPISVTQQVSQGACQSLGDTTYLPSRHLPLKYPQTLQPTLQSLRKTHLIRQQYQHSTRAPGTTVLSPDTEPINLNPEQQSILKNNLLRKPQTFLPQPSQPSSATPLQSRDVLMPPLSRPTHVGRPKSSVPVCTTTNEVISSTVEKSVLPNGQNIQSCKEENQARSTQFIQSVSRISPPNIDKDLLNPAACDPALEYSHGLKTLKSCPGGESKLSSTSDKEPQQRSSHISPDSTSVQIPKTPSSATENEPVQPTSTTSVLQKLRCNLCFSTFPTEKAYTKHMADDHKETKPHICGFCGKGFHDKFDLKRHYRTHTGVRPYKCSICPRAFTQRCSLETHVNKVHAMQLNFAFKERRKKIYVCEHCGNSVNDAFEHYLHMWAVHSRLAMPKRLRQKVLQRIKYILKTQNCGEKIGDELLADAQVVTQSISSLRDLGLS